MLLLKNHQPFSLSLCRPKYLRKIKPRKKKEAEVPIRPQVSWPKALRAVRAWLEPWVLLQRFWQAWSTHPPAPQLQTLVDCLGRGQALFLSGTDLDSFAQNDEAGLSLHPVGRGVGEHRGTTPLVVFELLLVAMYASSRYGA